MKFEDFIALERKDAAVEASHLTQVESVLELLEDYGSVPDNVRQKLMEEQDPAILKSWHKLAARSVSIQDFAAKAGIGCEDIPIRSVTSD